MRCRRSVGVVLILGAAALLGYAAPASATAASAPALSVAPSPVLMQITRSGLFDTRSTQGTAKGSLLVANTGAAAARGIKMAAYYSDGTLVRNFKYQRTGSVSRSLVRLARNGTVPFSVSFTWDRTNFDHGWIVVTDRSHLSAPVTVPFQIDEVVPGGVLVGLLEWAAGFAALIVFLVWLSLRGRPHQITEGPTWSFRDSWATNLTALGGTLATVLAASGFFSDVVPGLSTGTFVGFNLFYVALALLAPLVFQAFYYKGNPTYWGLLIAGWVVLVAVMGELATAVVLVNGGWLSAAALWAIFVGGMVGLAFYVRASIVPVIAPVATRTVDASTAATSAAATAAAIATAHGWLPTMAEADARAAARAAVAAANAVAGDELADQASAAAADAATTAAEKGEARQLVVAQAADAAREAIRATTDKRAATLMAAVDLPDQIGAAAADAARWAHAHGQDVKAAAMAGALAVIDAATARAAARPAGGKPTRVHPVGARPAAMW
jgi:hypothetical protein